MSGATTDGGLHRFLRAHPCGLVFELFPLCLYSGDGFSDVLACALCLHCQWHFCGILRVPRHAEQVPGDGRDAEPASCPRCRWPFASSRDMQKNFLVTVRAPCISWTRLLTCPVVQRQSSWSRHFSTIPQPAVPRDCPCLRSTEIWHYFRSMCGTCSCASLRIIGIFTGSVHRQSAGFPCCATETWYPQCCCTEDRLLPSSTVLEQSRCARVVQRQLLGADNPWSFHRCSSWSR